MTDAFQSWLRQLGSVPDLPLWTALSLTALGSLWLLEVVTSAVKRRVLLKRLQQIERRLAAIEAYRAREELKAIRGPEGRLRSPQSDATVA